MKKIKVVVDTNIFISGIFWGGNPGRIIKLWKNEKITICYSPETLSELINKLQRKFKLSLGYLKKYQQLFEDNSQLCIPEERVNICRDKKDNKFLELVLASKADYLITGDNDLLLLRKFKMTKIVNPKGFLKLR